MVRLLADRAGGEPGEPAPSAISPSSSLAGTSFAFGFPCMSTNCANRNSTSCSRM